MHANAILNLWYFIHTISKWVEKMVIPQASDYAGPRYRHIAGLPGCRTEGFGRRPGRSELSATATVDQGPAAIIQQKRQDVGWFHLWLKVHHEQPFIGWYVPILYDETYRVQHGKPSPYHPDQGIYGIWMGTWSCFGENCGVSPWSTRLKHYHAE